MKKSDAQTPANPCETLLYPSGDKVRGTGHFHTGNRSEIMEASRSHLRHGCVSQYMIDLSSEEVGKILCSYAVKKEADAWHIRNYEGKTVTYPLETKQHKLPVCAMTVLLTFYNHLNLVKPISPQKTRRPKFRQDLTTLKSCQISIPAA
ncbi:MAG: hypothetical protein R2941_07035 [Desulfobacterales bacterium]